MTVIKPGSTQTWAQVRGGSGLGPPQEVFLQVRVNDAKIQEQVPKFNGKEDVFALVPRETADGVQWDPVKLDWKYDGTENGNTIDIHQAYIPYADADVAAIGKYGVAFGMNTNEGTLWLQHPDHNTGLRGANGR
jgi:hypothetical protein